MSDNAAYPPISGNERVPIAEWTDIERRFVLDYRAKLVEFMGAPFQDELLAMSNDPERVQGSLEAAEHLAWMFRNDAANR